jgi:predicted phosphodiesterase
LKKVTDRQFIEAWERLGGAQAVSEELDMNVRSVHLRRRSIEASHGMELKAKHGMWVLKEQEFIRLQLDNARVLVSSDIHVWPDVETTAMAAFVLACEHMKPDVVVLNGDVFDGTTISRFGPSEANKQPSPKEELEACVSWVGRVAAAARKGNRKVRLIWTMGNHDNRYVRKLVEAAAGYAGIHGMDIRDHFPEWEFCYRLTINEGEPGHTDVVHNWAGGVHAAYNNVLRSGVSYVTGHTHRSLTRPWRDRTGMRWGVETGTGMEIDGPQAYYVAGRPVDWHPGFPLLTFHKGRLLRPEHLDVLEEGEFSFRGQVVAIDEFSQSLALGR